MSGAERQRRYRLRRKADPVKHAEDLRKLRENYQKKKKILQDFHKDKDEIIFLRIDDF